MNTNFYSSVTNFLKKRTIELLGLLLILNALFLFISIITYSPEDPSFIYGEKVTPIKNFFGIYGSVTSDFLLQCFGVLSFLIILTFFSWGLNLILKKIIKNILIKFFCLLISLIFGSLLIFITFNNSFWLIDNGNSGFVGRYSYEIIYEYFSFIENIYSIFFLMFTTITLFIYASDINLKKFFLNFTSYIVQFLKRKNSIKIDDYQN